MTTSKLLTAVKSAASVPTAAATETRTVVLEVNTAEPSGKEAVTLASAAAAPSVTDDCTPVVSSSASTDRAMTAGDWSPSVSRISAPFTVTPE